MIRRRRSTPWIQRWSRPIIGVIAILGAIVTAYLTITKLAGGEVACVASEGAEAAIASCKDVLNSRYATVFGLPLSLFGLLAYLSMATFALSPLAINPEKQKSLRSTLENWTWLFLLIGSTAMTVFSGYLMYVLAFEIKALCLYCISSATFATVMLLLTVLGRDWEDTGQLLFTGIVVAMVTLIGTLGIYSDGTRTVDGRIPIPTIVTTPQPPKGWAISTTSTEAEIALAEYLTEVGAKMYGAFWCPHCFDQKLLFGKEAFEKVDYIECDPSGVDPQSALCQETGVTSYPTWEIDGELYPGTQSLEKLAELTGYTGSTEFKYIQAGS